MMFSVIFSIDCPKETSIRSFIPPCRKAWDMTEGDNQYGYGYLEGRWTKGKHRKFCAFLTRKQFDKFVLKLCLRMENVQTMGSLGAPGLGFGVSPAFSFNGDDQDAILNAYVTPVPEFKPKHPERTCGERNWDRIKKAMLAVYK
jgi:hypothetical protein